MVHTVKLILAMASSMDKVFATLLMAIPMKEHSKMTSITAREKLNILTSPGTKEDFRMASGMGREYTPIQKVNLAKANGMMAN